MISPTDLAEAGPTAPLPCTALANATLADGTRADLTFADGVVDAVLPAGSVSDGPAVVDLTGYVLTAAAADPHSHLDKSVSLHGQPPAYGDLQNAIDQWLVIGAESDEADHHRRARQTALEMLSHGVTAIRSHCNLARGDDPLMPLRALVRLRGELAGVLDLEIAILPAPDTPTDDIVAAMQAGADIVGGCPHLAEDPDAELDRLLAVAHRFGTGIDIHADEQLTPHMLSVQSLARRVQQRPVPGTVTAGHCVSLGTLDQATLSGVLTDLRAGGVGVVTLPITNLYLQGWEHPSWTPRGLTALRGLLDAGVTVAAGGDNIRDPFNPVGRADPLETVALLVVAGHLTLDEAMAAATHGSRAVMGLPPAGTATGLVADLLAVKGSDLADIIARAPEDRVVFHRGRVVAASRTHRRMMLG